MKIIEVTSLQQPGLEVFSSLTNKSGIYGSPGYEGTLFIAESPKVIKVALESGYEPVSLLCEKKHIEGDAAFLLEKCPDIELYTGEREILQSLTGYKLTRGVLCAMKSKPLPSLSEICSDAGLIAVIDGVCDTTNIGSIFRSAAALGVNGIILTPSTCHPLNRRSVRVSMGSVFLVPWTFDDNPALHLKEFGFTTIALALNAGALPLDSPRLHSCVKKALFLGTEGDGLAPEIIEKCDFTSTIPMHGNVDSLNVGAAAAVAFWEFRNKYE